LRLSICKFHLFYIKLNKVNQVHILTKVFVVLVSLLAIALVPLAAVQASNQSVLRQQIKDKDVQVSAARSELDTERALRAKAENDTALQIKDLDAEKNRLQSDLAQNGLRVRSLEADISQSKIRLASLEQTIAVTMDVDRAKTELTKTLSEELDKQRTMLTDCERIRIDVVQKLGKTDSDLRVAQEALGDLKEQIASLSNEKVKSGQVVQSFTAKFGTADADSGSAIPAAAIPDRNVAASIVNVRRTDNQVYAEIDAGSRDGVKVGWTMTIGDGSRFIGKLKITSVDVNKSVGTVELEDVAARGAVRAGQKVTVRKGQ
jgi:chromosome segregation ATPase